MSKILYTLILSGVIAAASPVAFAQGPGAVTPPPRYPIGMDAPAPSVTGTMRQITLAAMPSWDMILNLSETQRSEIRGLLTKAEQDAAGLVETQKKTSKAFADALVMGAGEEKLTKLADEAVKAESAVFLDRIKTLAAVRKLLSEEQKQKLSEILDTATIPWRGFSGLQPTGVRPAPAKPAPATTPAQTKPAGK